MVLFPLQVTRERVAVLYEDRAAREAQYGAHQEASAAEAARVEARLNKAERLLHATTADYLRLKHEHQVGAVPCDWLRPCFLRAISTKKQTKNLVSRLSIALVNLPPPGCGPALDRGERGAKGNGAGASGRAGAASRGGGGGGECR